MLVTTVLQVYHSAVCGQKAINRSVSYLKIKQLTGEESNPELKGNSPEGFQGTSDYYPERS